MCNKEAAFQMGLKTVSKLFKLLYSCVTQINRFYISNPRLKVMHYWAKSGVCETL